MGVDAAISFARGAAEPPPLLAESGPLRPGTINWNIVLRMMNEVYDAEVKAMGLPTFAERIRTLKQIGTDLEERIINSTV
jgi:hypothetical protein